MPLVLGGSAVVTPAYSITNSCRFNLADSAYMTKTLGTPSSQKQFTFFNTGWSYHLMNY